MHILNSGSNESESPHCYLNSAKVVTHDDDVNVLMPAVFFDSFRGLYLDRSF